MMKAAGPSSPDPHKGDAGLALAMLTDQKAIVERPTEWKDLR